MKTQHDIMIDIETLGTAHNAIPVTIGVAKFVLGGEVTDKFQIAVHAGTAQKAGLTMDAGTLMWWMEQSQAAQASLIDKNAVSLSQALTRLTEYVSEVRNANHRAKLNVWANDPDFDLTKLQSAYDAVGQITPWKFWETRSCRTMVELGERIFGFNKKTDFVREGTHHNAADDAEYQALLMNHIYNRIKIL